MAIVGCAAGDKTSLVVAFAHEMGYATAVSVWSSTDKFEQHAAAVAGGFNQFTESGFGFTLPLPDTSQHRFVLLPLPW